MTLFVHVCCRFPVDPYCLVALSRFVNRPGMKGSKTVVEYQVVDVHLGC